MALMVVRRVLTIVAAHLERLQQAVQLFRTANQWFESAELLGHHDEHLCTTYRMKI